MKKKGGIPIIRKDNPVIGLLLNGVYGAYQGLILSAIMHEAKKNNVNLVIFGGLNLLSPNGFEYNNDPLIHLRRKKKLDGLVLLSGTLWHYNPTKQLTERFRSDFPGLPMASISIPIEGVPSVLVDNTTGVTEMMNHLIKGHGCRKIAFIKGTEAHREGQERLAAYLEALRGNNIPLDEDLVLPGDFMPASGEEAARILVEERKKKFDAIFAVNDDTAITAMDYLIKKGFHIPQDVIVTGFDDVEQAACSIPPLTTVRQPIYEQAKKAFELVLEQLNGKEVPETVSLPSQMVVRQSCGCFSESIQRIENKAILPYYQNSKNGPYSIQKISNMRDSLFSYISQLLQSQKENISLSAKVLFDLVESFYIDATSTTPSECFLNKLSMLVSGDIQAGRDISKWQDIISLIRDSVFNSNVTGMNLYLIENLFHKARVLIGELQYAKQGNQKIKFYYSVIQIRGIIQKQFNAVRIGDVIEILYQELLKLDIEGCYITLNVDRKLTRKYELVLAFDRQRGRFDQDLRKENHSIDDIFPVGILPEGQRYTLLALPLLVDDKLYGCVTFKIGQMDGFIYETLCLQLSSAIKNGFIIREGKETEKKLQEALADQKRNRD